MPIQFKNILKIILRCIIPLMKLFWKAYSVLFFLIVLSNASAMINQGSLPSVYYKTTIIFSGWYIFPYFFNIVNSIIYCVICLIIVAYAFDLPGMPQVPKSLFYARLLSDCFGHTYEMKMIQSGFSQGRVWGLIGLMSLILPVLPSYLVHWQITFKRKSLA